MSKPAAKIGYEARDGVAHITLDHAAKLNAMTMAMWLALPDVVARAEQDDDIRVIAVAGGGDKAFCAGADISQFGEHQSGREAVDAYGAAVVAGNAALASAGKPTVAVIRGICIGGGFGLAMCCDLRLATADSRFRIPAARLGLGYEYGVIDMLVRKIGMAGVADLLLSARMLDAKDALRYSIANNVWHRDMFDAEAATYLATIASNAPLTLRAIKRSLVELTRPEAERDMAAVDALIARCFSSEDYAEGQAAFREKRLPVFRGR